MKATVTTNFRGMHALVIHGDDPNRRVLVSVLGKLGLSVQPLDPQNQKLIPALESCDVILLDADVAIEGMAQTPAVPSIALIGTEAPSYLARVVRQGCTSHILKPIRSSGVFTALLLAVNEYEKRQNTVREIEGLRQRLAGRRIVTAAVLDIMSAQGLDQDEAYERLRAGAMKRRIPIEELAREYLAQELRAQGPFRRPLAQADTVAQKKLSTGD